MLGKQTITRMELLMGDGRWIMMNFYICWQVITHFEMSKHFCFAPNFKFCNKIWYFPRKLTKFGIFYKITKNSKRMKEQWTKWKESKIIKENGVQPKQNNYGMMIYGVTTKLYLALRALKPVTDTEVFRWQVDAGILSTWGIQAKYT